MVTWFSSSTRRSSTCSTVSRRSGVKINGKNQSFQCATAAHNATVATTGADSGTMMRNSTCSKLAPSMVALSVISAGISRKKLRMMMM